MNEKVRRESLITERLLQSELYRRSHCIFLYVSTPEEIDTHMILQDAFHAGKIVCVPLCGAAGQMTARRIMAMEELQSGAYGILEPDQTAELVLPEQIDLAIVPALACDRLGYRLGYGGGFYDRYLCLTNAVRIALCTEERLVTNLPHDCYDQRCHWIITERRVLHANEE